MSKLIVIQLKILSPLTQPITSTYQKIEFFMFTLFKYMFNLLKVYYFVNFFRNSKMKGLVLLFLNIQV